jgi:hypothetical protein
MKKISITFCVILNERLNVLTDITKGRKKNLGEWSLDRISLDQNCHFSVDQKF